MSTQNEFATRLSIAEAGNILNVSLDTIRRWEKKGLVKAHRDKNKHRFFNFEELKRLKTKLSGENNIGFKILTSKQKTPFKVVELFAGAGGLALGLHNAGLGCEMLVEIDKNAATTLKINKPNWNVINSDIGNIDTITYNKIMMIILAPYWKKFSKIKNWMAIFVFVDFFKFNLCAFC
jgi:DNA (cytosine-5)-methyltransferase 1